MEDGLVDDGIAALRDLVGSDAYLALLGEYLRGAGTTVSHDSEELILEIEAAAVAGAGLTVADLAPVVRTDGAAVLRYVRAKMARCSGPADEEYPPGHGPGATERDRVIDVQIQSTFLVGHLVEYVLLARGGDVAGYVRAARIPHAARYVREIRTMFDRVRA